MNPLKAPPSLTHWLSLQTAILVNPDLPMSSEMLTRWLGWGAVRLCVEKLCWAGLGQGSRKCFSSLLGGWGDVGLARPGTKGLVLHSFSL